MGPFDEVTVKAMADYLVANNRLRHAESRDTDATTLRRLRSEAAEQERACIEALESRGWRAPYGAMRVGA